jgi:regulator of sigma E protease
MSVVFNIFYFVITLGILISFHEFGHFWVARRCGVKVIRFSVGFGKPLWRRVDKLGTEYVVAAIPLGGYVRMLDEREDKVADQDKQYAFTQKNVWQRMAIVAAGPIANFLLAWFAYWVVFVHGSVQLAPIVAQVAPESIAAEAGIEAGYEILSIDGRSTPTLQAVQEQLILRLGDQGDVDFEFKDLDSGQKYASSASLSGWQVNDDQPNPIVEIGITPYQPTIVFAEVAENGPAEQAGLQAGDKLIASDGIKMTNARWVEYIQSRAGQSIELTVERNGREKLVSVTPQKTLDEAGEPTVRIGVGLAYDTVPEEYLRRIETSVFEAISRGAERTWDQSVLVLKMIKKMIVGDISAKHLSGPITIAKVAGQSADYGLVSYLNFLAMLSVSLGVLNLLPIPVLDGGHLLYYIVEAIKGSPVSDQIQMVGYKLGMLLVVSMMAFALFNDIMRLG